MPKPTAVWGIDIGQCALKALRLELIDGKPTATAFDYIEHPKILSQPDADPEQLTREALEKFLSRNQLKNDLIAIGVPGQSGLARFVKLPPVEEKKIPDIVKFEAKQQIPFPLEEVVWDYQKISGGEVVENFAMETEVGLFAMKREMISRYLGQFNAVKIECGVVQMAPLALTNFATYELLKRGGVDAPAPEQAADGETPRGKKRCAVVLDVGTDGSNLIITDGGKIIWQRPIPLGGNHFTRALTKEMKLTFAKAEHLKRNAAKSPDLAQILKALRPVLQDFVGEVQRSLGYFTNTHRDAHVAYMVGLGSAFKLPGLQKYMAEKLSLDVRKPTGFDRLAGDQVRNDPVFTENLLTFPIAYGLALQAVNNLGERKDYGRINTNLLPHEIRTERVIRAKKPWAAAAAAALLLGTGGMALGYAVQHSAVNDATMDKAAKSAGVQVDAANGQTQKETSSKGEVTKLQEDVKAVIAGNDEKLNFARVNEVVAIALPRAGAEGNLRDGTQEPLWSTPEGQRALQKYKERIKAGVPIDRAYEDDLTSDLAQVNVESVYCRYTDNLKGFMESADRYVQDTWGREIAQFMLDNEKEEDSAHPQKRIKPKGPDGGGWVFQVNGYTYYKGGTDFLTRAVVKNFQKANAYAEQTAAMRDPETGKPLATEKVAKFLAGAKDPVKGQFSHACMLISQPVDNFQADKFRYISKNYIDALLPADGAAAAAPGTTPPAGGRGDTSGPGAAATGGTWSPLYGSGGTQFAAGGEGGGGAGGPSMGTPSGGTGSMGTNVPGRSTVGSPPPGGPMGEAPAAPTPPLGAPAPPAGALNVSPKEKKVRYEFVLCFVWKEPAPGGPAAAADPAAAPK